MGRFLLALTAAALLTTFPAAVAQAAVFTVDTTVDLANANPAGTTCATAAGRCSLRAAITAANNLANVDTVALRQGTYTLNSALGTLRVTRSVTINGVDTRATVIDGGGRTGVLQFTTSGTSHLHGVTVTGGAVAPAIYVNGQHLIAERVAVRDNAISSGTALGAGIRIDAGDVTLTRSAVTGNRVASDASAPQGGGIFVANGATLVGETVTIAGNSATSAVELAYGGGVAAHGAIELRHATIWGNAVRGSGTQGSAIYSAPTVSARIADSIVGGGIGAQQCGGRAPVAAGVNVGGGAGCGFATADPRLSPLADAGGPTNVLVPAFDSPAIGTAATCFEGGMDQRGQVAPAGAACDVGAVELAADLAMSVSATSPTVAPGDVSTFLLTIANGGLDPADGAAVDVAVGGRSVVSATAIGGACTVGAAVRCELGDLARGDTAGVVLALQAPQQGAIDVTAVATSLAADPTPANATASASAIVVGGGGGEQPRPPTPETPRPPGPPAPPAPGAPTLTAVKVPGRPRAGRAFKVTATLSRDATVTVRVDRIVRGRRSGRGRRARCRAGARRGRACTTSAPAGTVTVAGLRAGRVTLTIPARLKRKRLAKGTYRLSLTARSADGLTSRAVVLSSVRLR